MPVILSAAATPAHEAEDVSALLFREDGRLTLEGQVIASFVESVDLEAAFESLADIATVETIKLTESETGDVVEGEGEDTEVECLDGEDVAEAVDADDLFSMFEHYAHALPEATIEEKAYKAAALSLIDEEALEEYAKGEFRKMVKKGAAGKALVNRMLGAMIAKQVIKRAKAKNPGTPRKGASGFTGQGGQKGAGYKGGDYEKNPPGYGAGTAKGKAVWMKFKSGGAGKATGKKQELKTRAAKKKGVDYKATMDASKVKKVINKKGKASPKGGALKKAMGEGEQQPAGKTQISESVALAARTVARRQINDDAQK